MGRLEEGEESVVAGVGVGEPVVAGWGLSVVGVWVSGVRGAFVAWGGIMRRPMHGIHTHPCLCTYTHSTAARAHRFPAWMRSGSSGSSKSCSARSGSLTDGCFGPWRAASRPVGREGWWMLD